MSGNQPTFTCSKLTIETLEQGVKHIFTPCSSVSIVNFEHVIAGWEKDMTWVWCQVIKINFQFLIIDFTTGFLRYYYKMTPGILLQNGSIFSWKMR